MAAVLSLVLSATVFNQPTSTGTAGAAGASPFQVSGNAAIRRATGTPAPPSGTHATLWANRAWATITLEGSGRVVLGAIADNCDGWPIARVTVDGAVVGQTTVDSKTDYGAYPVGAPLAAGTHKVTISMINDRYRPPSCDRNLHVGFARLDQSAAVPPAPVPITTLGPLPPAPSPTASPARSRPRPPRPRRPPRRRRPAAAPGRATPGFRTAPS